MKTAFGVVRKAQRVNIYAAACMHTLFKSAIRHMRILARCMNTETLAHETRIEGNMLVQVALVFQRLLKFGVCLGTLVPGFVRLTPPAQPLRRYSYLSCRS